jgi:alkylhydroperoxidase family enzyme
LVRAVGDDGRACPEDVEGVDESMEAHGAGTGEPELDDLGGGEDFAELSVDLVVDGVVVGRAPGAGQLTGQERLAVKFLDLLSADHHAIDDEVYRELSEVFTAAQIVELGFTCASTMGLHRFIHTLDVFGTDQPAIRYGRDQVDTAYPEAATQTL